MTEPPEYRPAAPPFGQPQGHDAAPVEDEQHLAAEVGGPEFDLERLDAVTEQFGYAVFGPTAPGRVRAPIATEYAQLLADLAPVEHEGDEPAPQAVDHSGFDEAAAPWAWREADQRGWPTTSEEQVDEIIRRTADPDFDYDPTAEWGDATYREPRSQQEADARTAYLVVQRAVDSPGLPPGTRTPTQVEDAIDTAAEDATLADRAHDPDPAAWDRYERLLALDDLAPLPPAPGALTGDAGYLAGLNDSEREQTLAAAAYDRGPWTDGQGQRWDSLGDWAARTAHENATQGHPSGSDDLAQLQRRIADARARLTGHHEAIEQGDVGDRRQSQLSQWNEDDQAEYLDCRIVGLDRAEDDGSGQEWGQ